MKSDLAKANMKHIKGVCENDSMSIFGQCSSNELLELFKSKKHARIFIHMLKSLVNRNHHFQANFLQNPFKVCISYTILIFYFWIMQNLCLGFWKLGIFENWVEFLLPVNIFQNLWLDCVLFAICAFVLAPCGNLIMYWGIFPYVHAFFITVVHCCMLYVWQIV